MKKGNSGNCYVVRTVTIRSLQTLAAFFPQTCCAKHKQHDNMLRENLDCSKKKFNALKPCFCVAIPKTVRILSAACSNSAASD